MAGALITRLALTYVAITTTTFLVVGAFFDSSVEAGSTPDTGSDFSGTYLSTITGEVWGLGGDRKLSVIIHRKDEQIYGSFGHGGSIRGVVDEGRISFEWISTRAKGSGEWQIDADGKGWNGTWMALTTAGDGDWDLVKTGPAPDPDLDHENEIEARNAMTNDSPDISGSYVSEITSNHPWYFDKRANRDIALTLTQSGNNIVGYDTANVAVITGTRDRNKIKFRFWAEGITAYELRGTWTISAQDTGMSGSWTQPSHAASGQWNLIRSN